MNRNLLLSLSCYGLAIACISPAYLTDWFFVAATQGFFEYYENIFLAVSCIAFLFFPLAWALLKDSSIGVMVGYHFSAGMSVMFTIPQITPYVVWVEGHYGMPPDIQHLFGLCASCFLIINMIMYVTGLFVFLKRGTGPQTRKE